MSKPMPKRPHTRMRLTVFGAKPRYGKVNGAAMSAITVSVSTRKRRLPAISCGSSFAGASFPPFGSEQAVRPDHQDERHGGEQHDVGVAGIDHGREAHDLAGDQAAQHRARKRADAADHDDDEGL